MIETEDVVFAQDDPRAVFEHHCVLGLSSVHVAQGAVHRLQDDDALFVLKYAVLGLNVRPTQLDVLVHVGRT